MMRKMILCRKCYCQWHGMKLSRRLSRQSENSWRHFRKYKICKVFDRINRIYRIEVWRVCPHGVPQIQAGKETLKRIDALLNRGDSFAIESTLSGLGYLSVIKHAKALGYDVFICYTFVDSPEVCIARIEGRVKKGGHFVPPKDVRRRYYRSKKNFWQKYSEEADYWVLCYNGT